MLAIMSSAAYSYMHVQVLVQVLAQSKVLSLFWCLWPTAVHPILYWPQSAVHPILYVWTLRH